MKWFLAMFVALALTSGCYNKIVFVSVDQEAAKENSLIIDDNVIDTKDKFKGDSQPIVELPLM